MKITKNIIKTVCLVLTLTLLCSASLFLTSCKELDEARNNRIALTDNRNTAVFREKNYKLLPKCELMSLDYTVNIEQCRAADEDIPILLVPELGYIAQYDTKNDLIAVTGWRYETGADDGLAPWITAAFYCNEADYDKYVELIDEYENAEYELSVWWPSELDDSKFSKEDSDRFFDYIDNVFMNEYEDGSYIEDFEESRELDVKRYYPEYDFTAENYYEIHKSGNKFYIVSNELGAHATLPDDIAEIFKDIFEKYEENNWYGYYSYDDCEECIEAY